VVVDIGGGDVGVEVMGVNGWQAEIHARIAMKIINIRGFGG